MIAEALSLKSWSGFYTIVGSAAGALTGLMFVVIALIPSDIRRGAASAARVFATPTIVHFTAALIVAAVLSMPGHTRASAGISLVIIASGMAVYFALVLMRNRRQDVYQPDLEDRLWHFLIPGLAYASLLVAALLTWSKPDSAMYVVAVSVLVLLIAGIHNAWDSAIFNLMREREE